MLFRDRWILFGATGCGAGFIPVAPGTFGALIGLFLAWCLSGGDGSLLVLFTLAFSGLSVWVAHEAERILGTKDPGAIVIDEVAGMLVACLGLPMTPAAAVVLFILFRLFDILKPFPVGWLDRRLTGGVGIVADDVAAGLLANVVYRAGIWLYALI
jgi:phosphatidylglycerophosphatase A